MRVNKTICSALVSALLFGTIAVPVEAIEMVSTFDNNSSAACVMPLATTSFSISIAAKTKATARNSLPLAAGDKVTITATYSPFYASVDFGLIAPDGTFYYFNVTDGRIDKTIQVEESGSYMFRVRNTSNNEISVSGVIDY